MRRRREARKAGVCGRGTHGYERVRAARGDRDSSRTVEPGVGADVVDVASSAAGERGGCPVGKLDTADAVIASVLRCIMEEHTLGEELSRRAV